MRIIKKHIKYLLLIAIMFFTSIVQLKAQFDDDGGPGNFDPPPDTDVPLDTYQWVMMLLAIAYGIYIYKKHQSKMKTGRLRLPHSHN